MKMANETKCVLCDVTKMEVEIEMEREIRMKSGGAWRTMEQIDWRPAARAED